MAAVYLRTLPILFSYLKDPPLDSAAFLNVPNVLDRNII